MKRFLKSPFVCFCFAISLSVSAQDLPKRVLDTSSIKNWTHVLGGSISNDGKYAAYGIGKSEDFDPSEFIVKSIQGKWAKKFSDVRGKVKFSDDSKFSVIECNAGKVFVQRLGTGQCTQLNNVRRDELITHKGETYLLYQLKNQELRVLRLTNGNNTSLGSFAKYELANSNKLYGAIATSEGSSLLQISLPDNVAKIIYQGKAALDRFVLSQDDEQLAFSNQDGNWFLYEEKTHQMQPLTIYAQDPQLKFAGVDRFEAGGKLLVVKFREKELPPLNPLVSAVKIFSYQDTAFFSTRQEAGREPIAYSAIYDPATGKISYMEQRTDRIRTISKNAQTALIGYSGSSSEYYWNFNAKNQDFAVDLSTGKKRLFSHFIDVRLSPDGDWAIGRDESFKDIYCLNTRTGKITNMTKGLPGPHREVNEDEEPFAKNSRGFHLFNWLNDGKSYLIYDYYDIWQLDLENKKPPVNLTGGHGRKSNISFRFVENGGDQLFQNGDQVVITAFNNATKENGFYRLTIGRPDKLEKLTMGPYLYQAPIKSVVNQSPPSKARDADVWLVMRESEQESWNWFWTKDFKTFRPVSENYPEKNYTWFTTELVNFKTKMGTKCQAILYKPKDFDPNKKYPVLFNYYQGAYSDKMHQYNPPKFTEHYYFNYPMMLSRGYLVCLSDTKGLEIGETAFGLVDALEGAADELAKRPYVDSQHYGACGGSFGGYATNCLAALSQKFAALVPIAAPSDLISMYGNYPGLGEEHTENRQMGMGVSLGSNPQRYFLNSPIVYTRQVMTPVLLVNTIKDYNVNVQQGIEWFISLRREGKLAWMLQYQETGHGIGKQDNQRDLYIRMNQFFDHYLKGAPAPVWMTRGISINDTGVKNGFEYDTEIKNPGPSQLIKADQ